MHKFRFFKSQITGSSGLINDSVIEAAHEGKNDGRNEAINEAINEAVNEAVNDTVKSPATLLHHFAASWRNKCRIKCRCKDIVSRCCLRIVFLLSGENKNDNRNEYRKLCLVFVSYTQKSIGLKSHNLSGWISAGKKMRLPFCDGRRIVIQI